MAAGRGFDGLQAAGRWCPRPHGKGLKVCRLLASAVTQNADPIRAKIMTGVHFAEEPLSRTCHMVSNVRLVGVSPSPEAAREVTVSSRFLVWQNRVEYESYTFVGRRKDMLRHAGSNWQIARREIILDQNVLLAKNLSTFF